MAKPKGNVYQINAHTWRVKYPLGKDPATGKYRVIQESYPTESSAWERLNRLRVEESDGVLVAPSRVTLKQFSKRWLNAKRATVRPNSVGIYREAVETASAFMGDPKLKDIDVPLILAWHAHMLETVSRTTANHNHRIFRAMMSDAVKWGVLASSPASRVAAPRRDQPDRVVWSRPQIETFLSYIEGRDDEAMWRLALTTGVRVGEMLTLQWDDLFDDKLSIRRTVSMSEDRKTRVLNEPKSETGRRTIILSKRVVDLLEAERQRQKDHRQRVGTWWNPDGWMFPSPRGRIYDPSTIRQRLARICESANVPVLTPHGLRHTNATDMMRSGVAPRIVQERLGHSNIAFTLALYSHPDEDMHRDVAGTIERVTKTRIVS